MLIDDTGEVVELKGKSADGQMALAFYRMFEITGNNRYRVAALAIADRLLQDMRATNYGVLPIKEKEKEDGRKFIGGGPPAMGFYPGNIGYILVHLRLVHGQPAVVAVDRLAQAGHAFDDAIRVIRWQIVHCAVQINERTRDLRADGRGKLVHQSG